MKTIEKPNFDWKETLQKAISENKVSVIDLLGANDTWSKLLKKANNNYDYWDRVKYYSLPDTINPEIFWSSVKFTRHNANYKLIFTGEGIAKGKKEETKPEDNFFKYIITDSLLKNINILDRHSGRYKLSIEEENEYSANSFMEEGIASSQLEGAAVTREIAKEMLRTNTLPRNKNEQMILNNYKAMEYIDSHSGEELTLQMIKQIHSIIANNTLDKTDKIGEFRSEADTVMIVDDRDNNVLFNPPPAKCLVMMLEDLCKYANEENEEDFTHPVIKAIIIHFWLAYIHPFIDGNGRTARALMYWYMLKNGYKSFKYLVISKIIKEKPSQYAKAFLYAEIDENDLTYFIKFNLDVIIEAVEKFNQYIEKKKEENKKTVLLIESDIELNFRQRSILKEFIKERNTRNIAYFKNMLNIAYETARTDLEYLVKKKFLTKKKAGRQYIYTLSKDLSRKVAEKKDKDFLNNFFKN